MKKIVFLIILSTALALAACGDKPAKSPEEAVKRYYEALGDKDGKKADVVLCGDQSERFDGLKSIKLSNVKVSEVSKDDKQAVVHASVTVEEIDNGAISMTGAMTYDQDVPLKKDGDGWCIIDIMP